MTLRARNLFDEYVLSSLNNPALKALGMGSHVFNLTSAAGEARIPIIEMTDEVGPLLRALTVAKTA